MKRKLSILTMLLLTVGLFIGCGSKNTDDLKKDDNEMISIDKAKELYPENTYGKVSEIIDDGVLMARLNSHSTSYEIIGISDERWDSGEESEYITVDIDIASSKQPLEDGLYSVSNIFYLDDTEGIQYAADDSITNNIRVRDKTLDYFGAINPKTLKRMQVVFQVPRDTVPERIAIKNKYNDDKWIVIYFN